MSFASKVVIITGASAGIGAVIAVHFTKQGADVAIAARNEENLKKVADDCEQHGKRPLVIIADITVDDDARKVVSKTNDTFGRIDILVNNAGRANLSSIFSGGILQTYDKIMSLNLRAAIYLTQLTAPHLIKTEGNIINISSVASTCCLSGEDAIYMASKAALDHFTRGAALELAGLGVRVNSVNPGYVDTRMLDIAGVDKGAVKEKTPLKKMAEPEEVADLVLFLAGGCAKSITGSAFVVDNGYLLKN